jgi:leucyl-tRNA synthetase
VAPGLPEAEVEAIVMAQPRIIASLEGKQVIRVIHVGGRLVNIVVR